MWLLARLDAPPPVALANDGSRLRSETGEGFFLPLPPERRGNATERAQSTTRAADDGGSEHSPSAAQLAAPRSAAVD